MGEVTKIVTEIVSIIDRAALVAGMNPAALNKTIWCQSEYERSYYLNGIRVDEWLPWGFIETRTAKNFF